MNEELKHHEKASLLRVCGMLVGGGGGAGGGVRWVGRCGVLLFL